MKTIGWELTPPAPLFLVLVVYFNMLHQTVPPLGHFKPARELVSVQFIITHLEQLPGPFEPAKCKEGTL